MTITEEEKINLESIKEELVALKTTTPGSTAKKYSAAVNMSVYYSIAMSNPDPTGQIASLEMQEAINKEVISLVKEAQTNGVPLSTLADGVKDLAPDKKMTELMTQTLVELVTKDKALDLKDQIIKNTKTVATTPHVSHPNTQGSTITR